jgi:hypothetical protein
MKLRPIPWAEMDPAAATDLAWRLYLAAATEQDPAPRSALLVTLAEGLEAGADLYLPPVAVERVRRLADMGDAETVSRVLAAVRTTSDRRKFEGARS